MNCLKILSVENALNHRRDVWSFWQDYRFGNYDSSTYKIEVSGVTVKDADDLKTENDVGDKLTALHR